MPVATDVVREDPRWPSRSETPTDRLALVPAGPPLVAALAAIDRAGLDGFGLVLLLRARSRLISHLQAEQLADMTAMAAADERPFGTAE
ncbi:MAG: hypothetical protein ACT4OP_11090, partial [Actinomycetota bacterium]